MSKISIIKIIIHTFMRYGNIIMLLVSAIIGFILAKRKGNVGTDKKIYGCLTLVMAVVIGIILPYIPIGNMTVIMYVVISLLSYAIYFIAILISLKFFCEYKPERWIMILFLVLMAVHGISSFYNGRIYYGMSSLLNGMDKGFLSMFMNNPKALDTVSILCTFVLPISVFMDSLINVKKAN